MSAQSAFNHEVANHYNSELLRVLADQVDAEEAAAAEDKQVKETASAKK